MKRTLLVSLALAASAALPRSAAAHGDHDVVPSSGVTVVGEDLLVSESAAQRIGLDVEQVRLGDLRRELEVTCRLELPVRGQARVTSIVAGRVDEVLVRSGDRVEPGQVLARVSSLDVERLADELFKATSDSEYAESLVDRRSDLVASGGGAAKALLESRSDLRQHLVRRDVLREKLVALGLTGDELARVEREGRPPRSLALAAPIEGIVEHVEARPGQLVNQSDHLFSLVDNRLLLLVGRVLEGDAHLVHAGQEIRFHALGAADAAIGRVEYVRPRFDEAERAVEAVATIENPTGALRPGLVGRGAIAVEVARDEVLCPAAAVMEFGGEQAVLRRVAGRRFRRQTVRLGLGSEESVVVADGLFPGQEVATVGAALLAAMLPQAEAVTPGSGAPPRRGGSAAEVHARGLVELSPQQQSTVTSLVEGRVSTLWAQTAGWVEAGDPLVELESQSLRDIQLDLMVNRSKLDWLGTEVERLRPLVQSRATPEQALRQRELEAQQMRHEIESLTRRLEMIGAETGERRGRLTVRAPIAGQVADILVVPGETVHSLDSLLMLVDLRRVWVRASVLEEDAARVAVGQPAEVSFPSDPGRPLSGRVVRVAPQLVTAERVLPVWVELDNADGFLKPGMLAHVRIAPDSGVAGVTAFP